MVLKKQNLVRGFTLVELLVVISIIALLLAVLMPALSKARDQAKKVYCSSLQKQWGLAVLMYAQNNGNNNTFAWRGDGSTQNPYVFWFDYLEPYFNRKTGDANRKGGTFIGQAKSSITEDRRCPGGKREPKSSTNATGWTSWIGVFGSDRKIWPTNSGKINAAFFRADPGVTPSNLLNMKRPSEDLMLMDSSAWLIYSPVQYPWIYDQNKDGYNDTYWTQYPFNAGRPEVHNKGCNITLFDGHVEYIKFNELWEVQKANDRMPVHRYLYFK